MNEAVETLAVGLVVFLAIFGVPLLVTAMTVLWLNPVTILEKIAVLCIGVVVFFLVLGVDLIVIAIAKD